MKSNRRLRAWILDALRSGTVELRFWTKTFPRAPTTSTPEAWALSYKIDLTNSRPWQNSRNYNTDAVEKCKQTNNLSYSLLYLPPTCRGNFRWKISLLPSNLNSVKGLISFHGNRLAVSLFRRKQLETRLLCWVKDVFPKLIIVISSTEATCLLRIECVS